MGFDIGIYNGTPATDCHNDIQKARALTRGPGKGEREREKNLNEITSVP